MTSRTGTGGYAVGRRRREAILDAATAHFSKSGYAQTPMAVIAQDVGLSERGLLHHFPTKKHLLLAVAGRRFDFAIDWVADVPETPDGLRPLRALLEMTTEFIAHPGLIELFVLGTAEAADRNGPAFALYSEQYERAVTDLESDFRRSVDLGILRADVDYAAMARRCIAICDGLQLQWVLSGGALDLIGELRTYLRELATSLVLDETAVGPGAL